MQRVVSQTMCRWWQSYSYQYWRSGIGFLYLVCALLAVESSATESLWSDREVRILASLRLHKDMPVPDSPSNRVANSDAAAAFGGQLFFDKRLSRNGAIACASCHQPERYFVDNLTKADGVGANMRNTPTIVGSAYLSWFYWDGRRDSLWAQALTPFEAPAEMGSSRLAVVRMIAQDKHYRSAYEALFGPLFQGGIGRDVVMSEKLSHAGPLGSKEDRRAWQSFPRPVKQAINEVFANVGKAIAAYERTLKPAPTRFDRYVETLLSKEKRIDGGLSNDEIAGAKIFIDAQRSQCLQCHNGPLFANGGFHNIGTGNFDGSELDFGRVFGVRAVLLDEFNCLGRYSDAKPTQCRELRFLNRNAHVPLEGAYKVPGLRQLSQTKPYMHDGRFERLEQVIDFYRAAKDDSANGELQPFVISDREADQLKAFLLSLSDQ